MKRYILLLLVFCCAVTTQAQQTQYTAKDYARTPVWIGMMDDTTANYFEAEKAYKIYWQHHEKPEGENDVIGEHAGREKIPSKHKQQKIQQDNKMRMAVKKYERWHSLMLPYVQPDGRILTPTERLAIWEEQKQKNK